jgi:hypothetical protein
MRDCPICAAKAKWYFHDHHMQCLNCGHSEEYDEMIVPFKPEQKETHYIHVYQYPDSKTIHRVISQKCWDSYSEELFMAEAGVDLLFSRSIP